MAETQSPIVVPYADFLARRERRDRAIAKLVRPVDPSPIDTDPLPVEVAVAVRPISGEQK